jgi:tRNA (guanine37-N1)-methyltransferase
LVGESFPDEEMLGPRVDTRPAGWDGEAVPAVLSFGDHTKIKTWRQEQSRLRASQRRSGTAE